MLVTTLREMLSAQLARTFADRAQSCDRSRCRDTTSVSKAGRNRNIMRVELLQKTYRTADLPVVLYGCETWSLTLSEEYRMRVFQNRVLREIFGPERDEVTGEWRKLRSEELNDLYCSPSIVRVIK